MRRKSTPRVVGGRVQPKNRSARTFGGSWLEPLPAVNRMRPGRLFRHVAEAADVARFVRLLPRWAELSRGLRAIVLVSGDEDCMGYYTHDGVIGLSAWPREIEMDWDVAFWREHREVLERLDVPVGPAIDGEVRC